MCQHLVQSFACSEHVHYISYDTIVIIIAFVTVVGEADRGTSSKQHLQSAAEGEGGRGQAGTHTVSRPSVSTYTVFTLVVEGNMEHEINLNK